ncbi:MAG TPA: HYR domain-containing protein, partial [Phaeodactylibacter sp.]|nr:HYR domain-containing protein [Phaeodactylibacter sp.]
DLLFEKTYDPLQTAALNLPATVDGAAFKDVNGQFTYVLWAICQTDDSEVSNAIYSFPTSFNLNNLESKAWDYSLTNQQAIISSQNIILTGSPIFLTASNQQISFTCPADIAMTVNSNQTGATVNWSPPTASTLCNDPTINITQTGGLPNGSFFPIGTTTVTYEITDNCGNMETCNFTVTIDQAPPVVNCANGQHELNITIIGNGSVDIEFINPAGDTQTCSDGTCTYCVDANTLIKFVGVPNLGETFMGWTGGGCSGSSVCWKTINWETNITATFSQNLATTIDVTATSTDVSCNGGSDGNILINVSGGAPLYTYNWSNGITTSQLNNVSAGSYVVTVTDSNGITATASATVNQPAALVSLIINQSDISCIGSTDGAATASGAGGTPPYYYSWSNGGALATVNNLSVGNHTVTITDENGCTTTSTVTIGAPMPLNISVTPTDASCVGNSDGSAIVSVSGGNAPYNYAWSGGSSTSSITNSLSGTYTVTVSDNNGCTISSTTVISNTNANAPTVDFSKNINALTVDFTDISTGNPDTWLWEFGDGTSTTSSTTTHTYADAGTYLACLTASNGCGQNIACQNISVGLANNVNIMLEDIEGNIGTIIHLPVRVSNFENMVSFQHSFIIEDTTKAVFVGTSNFITSLLGNPASINVDAESINTVWLTGNGTPISVIDGTALYYLDILIKGAPAECTNIILNDQNFPTEFIMVNNGNVVQVGSNFTAGEVCSSPGVIVSGKIITEDGALIEEVNIFNNNTFTTTSGTTGNYALPAQSAGNNYLIEAHKDTNYVNGVTSFDLAIIQQHIVGNVFLDSPYKIIAADINHSGTVTSFDLWLAQQVIVGTIDTFPDNESWRFVPADFVFPNPDSPFVTGFPEAITLNNLDTNMANQDFIAIKVGDVNATALPNNFDGGTSGFTRSTDGGFNFLVKKHPANSEEFYVDFLAKDFQDISAFQFDLFFEKNNIELLRVENTGLNTHHGVHLEEGMITLVWYATQDFKKSIEDNASLFRVYFKEKNNALPWDKNIRISQGITPPIAYQSSGK